LSHKRFSVEFGEIEAKCPLNHRKIACSYTYDWGAQHRGSRNCKYKFSFLPTNFCATVKVAPTCHACHTLDMSLVQKYI